MRTGHILRAAVLGVALLGAQCAFAQQTLYKLIDKNGKVTYSEEKPKDFDGQVIPLNINPNANTTTLPKSQGMIQGAQAARLNAAQQLSQAQERLAKANAALKDAKDNASADERMMVGKVGGGVRYVESDDYQKKIQGLEKEVKDAEDNLARAEKGG